ncbi:hypothetical protein, partial [Streptosporangium sp. NPDC002524]|uniref:hypothetical protein n=1 Tax=Streptosporangium sp. NPDC002524 TaxID=3154537 RepID=UPI00332D6EB6
ARGQARVVGAVHLAEELAPLEAVYGKNSEKLKENIRISFSEMNTIDEVNLFVEKLSSILKK